MKVEEAIRLISRTGRPDRDALVRLISTDGPGEEQAVFAAAYEAKKRHRGRKVYFRGLIEFSNICSRNCSYCGIRRANRITRYAMSEEEILVCARFAIEGRYGSVVLQSGERDDDDYIDFVDRVVRGIIRESGGKIGITLACGEQRPETYMRWFESGAHRYLLRIETSDPVFYSRLHPADQSFDRRMDCLSSLKAAGYQVGTGVMIGLPGQSAEQLADDVLFFFDADVDMIGMGPYVLHDDTPLATEVINTPEEKKKRLSLALRMIAIARIVMPDVNIAAPTALQALDPAGREKGLMAGANVIMPNLTPVAYRSGYLLYEGKPCVDEEAKQCRSCLERRIRSIGESVGWDEWGDSPHFMRRTGTQRPKRDD